MGKLKPLLYNNEQFNAELEAYLKTPEPDYTDRFGIAVAISENSDHIIIADQDNDSAGTDPNATAEIENSGSAYIYH